MLPPSGKIDFSSARMPLPSYFPVPSCTHYIASIYSSHAQFSFSVNAIVMSRQLSVNLRDDNMANTVPVHWSNVNCERDIVDTLVWNRWIFRILGIWPLVYADISLIERILATVSFTLCWSALGFLLIPMIIYTLSEQTVKNEKVKMLGPLSFVILSLLKYLFLVVQHRSIRQCIRLLSADWRNVQHEDHRRIMIDDAAKGHVLSKFCVVFMYCGGLSYHTVMPFLAKMPDNNHNVTVMPIPYPGFDIIFDLHFKPAYVFVFCAQWLSGIVLFNISTAVCCTASMFVSHACGQIGIVMAQMENLVNDLQSNHVNSEQRMAVIVKHHVHALR